MRHEKRSDVQTEDELSFDCAAGSVRAARPVVAPYHCSAFERRARWSRPTTVQCPCFAPPRGSALHHHRVIGGVLEMDKSFVCELLTLGRRFSEQ